ncbi:MAG: type II secretion system GspH family protein [Lachnospiraceae bacterium]|nr:type II secretion system GspH family protein [Lachnospiraceae bacterium]
MKKIFSSKLHTRGNSGYTLVELLVSMTLTAIFATVIVAVMPSATRIYMQIKDAGRAQVVADMIVDALREECADTYIEDYASVRILNAAPTAEGDTAFLGSVVNSEAPETPPPSGNILMIRKSAGYCETIYSCIAISAANYDSVLNSDQAKQFDPDHPLGRSSRAVYRFFPTGVASQTPETAQGYVHYGYYQAGTTPKTVGSETINCVFPATRYDYTNPFTNDAYNGYTVDISFSDINYTVCPGAASFDTVTKRPESVTVTVRIYRSDFGGQNDSTLLYTRDALLVFAKDTTE